MSDTTSFTPEQAQRQFNFFFGISVLSLLMVAVAAMVWFSSDKTANESLLIPPTLRQNGQSFGVNSPAPLPSMTFAPTAQAPASTNLQEGQTVLTTSVQPQERIILKNAVLALIVTDPEKAASQITALVEDSGGWVVSSNVSQFDRVDGQQTRATMRLRLPANQFTTLLDDIKAIAKVVTSEVISSSDVTNQYVDSQSRLRNLEAAEVQLAAILENARTTNDVLAVFAELSRTRGEIEVLKGQLQYWDEAASYSQVDLQLDPPPLNYPTVTPTPTPTPERWSPSETFNNATDSAVGTIQSGIDGLIWVLVYGVLLLVVVGLPFYLMLRFLFRKS